mgnify:CR=1 FL=1
MVLDSNQFNQLVEEVRKALLAGSQGVGDVEKVDSLDDIVSLPALRLSGMEESVVEAPLKMRKKNVPLLKAPVPPLKLRVSIRRKTV